MSGRKPTPNELEEMVRWSMANPQGSRYDHAGRPALQDHFGIGSGVAHEVAKEAARRMAARREEALSGQSGEPPAEGFRFETRGDEATLTTVSHRIRTLDDALAHAEVDRERWEVKRFVVNSWEMGYKSADEGALALPLWQVKAWLGRRESTGLEQALEALIERMPAAPPADYRPVPPAANRMCEVALYDLHFGMLAWSPETGEDYDVSIARRITADAANQIAERTRDLGVESFLLPIGNDLFHVNDPSGQTPASKNRLDVDSRLGKITEEAALAMQGVVSMLAEIAPVKLLWVPGNHDPQTSYYLLREMAAWWRDTDRIQVDTDLRKRKYVPFGRNLIGFMHGCDLPKSRRKELKGLMADEAADLWRSGQYREIHTGHRHKKSMLSFVSADTYGSTVVRTIPSLVATDAWHFAQGFVQTTKTAQIFIWDAEYGLVSVEDIHVDPALYADQPAA